MSEVAGLSRAELEALVVAQAEVIEALRAEVAELRGRLGANSRNSSRPPSSDGYRKPPVAKSLRRPSGRKPGGQEGHPGHRLMQRACPDEVVVHAPGRCDRCGGEMTDSVLVGEEVRQVFELPAVGLFVTEHRVQQRRCCGCGQRSSGRFPAGVRAPAQYGPRLRSLIVYLVIYQHLPYDRTARLLGDWLGAPLSTGTIHATVEQAGERLAGFCERVREQLITTPVIGVDETGARAQGRLRWVHSASSEQLTLYRLHDQRGQGGIDHLGVLTHYHGTVIHDGWQPYRGYQHATHALCNVHHLRELQGAIERDPTHTWATQMDELLRELKRTVEDAKRDGQRSLPARQLASYRHRYAQIITLGHRQCPTPKRVGKRGVLTRTQTTNLLHRLDTQRDQALRFAHDFTVPFDNNLSERDLRMIKLQQKISGSWRTITGAQHFLALRSYLSTTQKHGRELLQALTDLTEGTPWLPATTPT